MAFREIRIDFQSRFEISDRLVILGWIRQDSCQIKICLNEILVDIGGFLKVYLGLVEITVFLTVVRKFVIGEGIVGVEVKRSEKVLFGQARVVVASQDHR